MYKRVSIVNHIDINSCQFSSNILLGDANKLSPNSKVFAVQREHPIFFGNEGDLNQYPMYMQEIPLPLINEHINIQKKHENPTIYVNNIHVIGISTSSLLQIGSNHQIHAQARTKHIRQLKEA